MLFRSKSSDSTLYFFPIGAADHGVSGPGLFVTNDLKALTITDARMTGNIPSVVIHLLGPFRSIETVSLHQRVFTYLTPSDKDLASRVPLCIKSLAITDTALLSILMLSPSLRSQLCSFDLRASLPSLSEVRLLMDFIQPMSADLEHLSFYVHHMREAIMGVGGNLSYMHQLDLSTLSSLVSLQLGIPVYGSANAFIGTRSRFSYPVICSSGYSILVNLTRAMSQSLRKLSYQFQFNPFETDDTALLQVFWSSFPINEPDYDWKDLEDALLDRIETGLQCIEFRSAICSVKVEPCHFPSEDRMYMIENMPRVCARSDVVRFV